MPDQRQFPQYLSGQRLPPHRVPALFGFEARHRAVIDPAANNRGHDARSIPGGRADSSFQPGNPGARRGHKADADAGAARAAIHYVAPVGEKEEYVGRAMRNVCRYLVPETGETCPA